MLLKYKVVNDLLLLRGKLLHVCYKIHWKNEQNVLSVNVKQISEIPFSSIFSYTAE